MAETQLHPDQIAALASLANGIIPADATDAGAAAVEAGPRLAERIRTGVNAGVYLRGLELAQSLARKWHGLDVNQLSPEQIHDLLAVVRDELPAFFKQLRMDISALYLSDPGVWKRIRFPGPSAETGGYPDFDQPQNAAGAAAAAAVRLSVLSNGNTTTGQSANRAR